MTTPFPFTPGQVLTAAQMNAITELVVNDKTASHTLTAADAGDRVIMNSASATTITVNTSVFTAGQVIYVTNKGAGVCTITAGTATVSTTGTLALAQFASGVLYCISAGVFLFEGYDRASGLTLISSTAFTTASTVSLPNDSFTSTFQNYKVQILVTAFTSAQITLSLRFRTAGSDNTTAKYNQASAGRDSGGNAVNITQSDTTSLAIGQTFNPAGASDRAVINLDIFDPKVAGRTLANGFYSFPNAGGSEIQSSPTSMLFRDNTSFDSLTLISNVATSITGVARVYGYANS